MTQLIAILALATLLTASCQKQKEAPKTDDPVTQPEPPAQEPATVTIISASMLEDCPDAAAEEAKSRPPEAEAARELTEEEMDEDQGKHTNHFAAPCDQSTMQLAITGQGQAPSTLKIVGLRLLTPEGKVLDTIKSRSPMFWKDNGYVPWDQVVPSKTDVKASYKISIGNWSNVEKTLGGSSYGRSYLVEADVEIDGVPSTIRSSPSARYHAEVPET